MNSRNLLGDSARGSGDDKNTDTWVRRGWTKLFHEMCVEEQIISKSGLCEVKRQCATKLINLYIIKIHKWVPKMGPQGRGVQRS